MKILGWILIVGISGQLEASARPKIRVDAPNQEQYYSTVTANVSDADKRKANQIRLQSIESIKGLLAQKQIKGPRRFELLLRLGELYAEGHDYVRNDEELAYDAQIERWTKSGRKGPEPKQDYKKSKSQLANAAEAFRKLVKEFPREARTAAALYSLGKTLARLGDDNSVIYFEKLIKDHPKSPLVADAYLAKGDFYFDKHKIDKSVDAYKNFIRFKQHVAYPYGVYKLGWAYYNSTAKNDAATRDHINKAITSFKLTIKLADEDERRKLKRIDLKKEAMKDLVMVWAETEDTDSAWTYFKTIGEKQVFYDLLERLGGIYADQGKNAKAIDLYTRLVQEAPTREALPRIYERMLELYDTLGQPQRVVETLTTMHRSIVKGGAWSVRYAKEQDKTIQAEKTVEFAMHRYGTLYHQRSQKASMEKYLVAANQIYTLYLDSYPKSSKSYEIRYYYADTLAALKKNEAAADQYTLVVNADPKGKFLKESAVNAVAELNIVDQKTKALALPPAGQVPKPIALPRLKVKLLAAMDRYNEILPKEKLGYPMRFTAAQTYFDFGHYDEAMKRFTSIVNDIPETKQANVALKIILAYRVERKDYAQAIALAQKFLSQKNLSAETRGYAIETLRNAMFNQALEAEKDQKFDEAAKSFVALYKAFPQDKTVNDKSLFNASGNYFRAGMLEDAIAVNLMLVEKIPDSSLVSQAILNVGQTYEALGQYDRAASYFKQFAHQYPKEKLASRALYSAAVLYQGLNQSAEAEKLFGRFVQFYPYNSMVNDARLEVAKLQEKQNQLKSAVATYRAMSDAKDPELALLGSAKASVLMQANGQTADGRKLMQQTIARLSAKDAPAALEARSIIAGALFKESEALFQATKQMKIASAKTLEADVSRKQRNLEILGRRYKEIMAIDSPEHTVASLYRLGELHEDLSEKLFAVQPADGSSQLDASKFKTTIEKVALPLRDEAYQFYETAYKRSQEVETFTEWTRRTYDKMAELAPEKNPAVMEIEADPNYLVHKLSLDKTTAPLAH